MTSPGTAKDSGPDNTTPRPPSRGRPKKGTTVRHLHNRQRRARHLRLAAVLASATLALTACGGGSVGEQTKKNAAQEKAAGGKCGDFKIIVNNWVGYQAD